uniref:RAB23, member RAS oncogene family [Orcinus orca] n=2 Tax=Lepeophtheirus salmonis TaxID=72036 RepID=A0A0K2UFP6_LEPSM
MIQRYCRGIFTKNYKKTIGVDFLEKHLRISGEDVRLMLWDTAGQEEFDAITKAYYRGAQACVIAFSTTDRSSFEAVGKWKKKVEDECGSIPMVLVQNKIDLEHESVVNNDEVDRLCHDCRMKCYRTSVKEDLNVVNVFQHLAENYVHYYLNQLEDYSNGLSQIGVTKPIIKKPNTNTSSNKTNKYPFSYKNISYTRGSFTPQDYLNNPMFDSLHHHNRRIWSTDRTITLKPLVNFKKHGFQRKIPLGKGSCKVL